MTTTDEQRAAFRTYWEAVRSRYALHQVEAAACDAHAHATAAMEGRVEQLAAELTTAREHRDDHAVREERAEGRVRELEQEIERLATEPYGQGYADAQRRDRKQATARVEAMRERCAVIVDGVFNRTASFVPSNTSRMLEDIAADIRAAPKDGGGT